MVFTKRNLDSSPARAKVHNGKVISHFVTLVAAALSVPQAQLAVIILPPALDLPVVQQCATVPEASGQLGVLEVERVGGASLFRCGGRIDCVD